ncbi:TPA: DNA repair protein RecO [Candidatus Uhrbacteria bacterium]|uniref:DNA repair protein RecO n=2 Tax=Candidatus Uhriibacteriota TaxID=1752732 RepID=A0A0G1T740_9BACT|nr:MAG: repair protein RecO protein [Candidatus Uhrbacteria bacterium GW2011_GWF2_46_218]KKU41205.1 MAG: repair protein RecO protein [Candidatus Uhrbacteria bacterium GW2011_GWE2_46_68]HBK34053.1 DNA repair protein RecO [Candidatus Uhrbacteria bacterium]HCB18869.1 DNA repair protein RecO [Candidatus Uhrbacteria bacterium]
MSTLFSTTGIILSCRDHKEVDRWYAMYTKDYGKIEFLARGGQKVLAKLTPHLETLGEVHTLLVQGRQYPTLTGVERKRAFLGAQSDYQKMVLAQNAMSLMDMGTRPHEADPVLYDVLHQWLSFLDTAPSLSPERSAYLLGSFSLKLLALLGYRPELHQCLRCRQSVRPKEFYWHALKGGIVCVSCRKQDSDQYFAARPMEETTLKLIRFAMGESFSDQLRPPLPGETLLAFHEAIEALIISHFPIIPVNSLRASCQ